MAMLICSTWRSNESWTSTRRYGHVVVAVANTTAATYRTRRAKPSSSVGDLNVGTVEPRCSQTRRLISRPVQLHVRASSSHEPITSSQNSTKRPATFVPPGERHRDCCTADTRSCTMTPSRAFQFGQKSFDSIRFANLINLPLLH